MIHRMPLRIYFEDTDAGGIVYHSNYLNYAERARSEFLISVGLSNRALIERQVAFVVRRAQIEYLAPARLDDMLTVCTRITDVGNASIVMEQTVIRGPDRLVQLTFKLAFINPETMKPIRIPDDLKAIFCIYMKEGV